MKKPSTDIFTWKSCARLLAIMAIPIISYALMTVTAFTQDEKIGDVVISPAIANPGDAKQSPVEKVGAALAKGGNSTGNSGSAALPNPAPDP